MGYDAVAPQCVCPDPLYSSTIPKFLGGETVSTGVCKVQVACRGARGLVKTGKNRKANDNAFALAA